MKGRRLFCSVGVSELQFTKRAFVPVCICVLKCVVMDKKSVKEYYKEKVSLLFQQEEQKDGASRAI